MADRKDRNSRPQKSPYVGDDRYDAKYGQGALLGFIYQLNLLMLFTIRGLRTGLNFRLATEMMGAEAFDDLVLEHKNNAASGSKSVYRFLQAKHKRKKSKIDDKYLSSSKDFNLKQYFDAYCEMKKHPTLSKGKLETFVIYTNIDLDEEKFKSAKINIILDDQYDEYLTIEPKGEKNRRYRFSSIGPSKLYEILASEAYNLVQVLVKKVLERGKISNEDNILKKYRSALAMEVINITDRKLSDAFVEGNGLSQEAKNFRDEFYHQVLKQMGLPEDYKDEERIWNKIKDKTLEIDQTFVSDLELENVKELCDEFEALFKYADDNIGDGMRMWPRIPSQNESQNLGPTIQLNIMSLLYYVFRKKNEDTLTFRPEFLQDHVGQPDSILELKQHLRNRIEDRFNDLGEYQFKISNLEDKLCSMIKFPNRNDNDKEIPNFLDRLILAVGQPNEGELGVILRKEIGEDFTLDSLDADLVTESFERNMRHWFLEEQGTWLSNEEALNFVNAIKNKIQILKMSQLSLVYVKKLENYGIDFKEENKQLTDYLTQQDTQDRKTACNLVAPGETLTAAIQVHRAVKNSPRFCGEYESILIRLNDLLLPGIKELVFDAFRMQGRYNLLAIIFKRCDDRERWELNGLYEDLHKIMINVRCNIKKLIFVTNMELNFRDCYNIHCKLSFNDLTDESQRKLLNEHVVKFQGREKNISFAKLLRIFPGENEDSDSFKDSKDAIDSATLEKLIRGKDIKIGSLLKSSDQTEDYFVDRTFQQRNIIKVDILKSEKTCEIYAVGNVNRSFLKTLEMIRNAEPVQEIQYSKRQQLGFHELNSGEEQEQFEKLCKAYSSDSYNVHWLMARGGELLWIRSKGSTDTLLEYKDSEKNDDCECEVFETLSRSVDLDELAAGDVGPVIISAVAGMGKTTVLTHFARKLKEKYPNMWVIRINLIEHTNALEKQSEQGNVNLGNKESVTEFFINDILELSTETEKVILKYLITIPGGVALLLDGFDEISLYNETVSKMLEVFREDSGPKLIVTTRPHMEKELESTLRTFSYAIKQFSEEGQINFVVRFWKNVCQKSNETLLRKRAEMVLKKIGNAISDRSNEFAGIPLHTRMIAEVFLKLDVPDHIRVAELYRMFFDEKYKLYCVEKKEGKFSNPAVRKDAEELKTKRLRAYQRLAMYTLLKDEHSRTWNLSAKEIKKAERLIDEMSDDTDRIGIVTNVIEQRAHFIHRTFLEYFVASYLFENLGKSDDYNLTRGLAMFILNEILLRYSQYKGIRAFLNDLLSKPPINSIFDALDWEVELYKNTHGFSIYDKNIFHIAAEEGNYEIMRFFFSRLAKNFSDPRKVINLTMNHSKTNLIHIVISKDQLNGSDLAVVTWLLDQNADVNGTDQIGNTPMHMATVKGHFMALKLLADQRHADMTVRNCCGQTLQHIAAERGNLEILNWLLNQRGCRIDVRDILGGTLQHAATRHGKIDTLKWLVEDCGCNVNVRNDLGTTLQHVAAESCNLDMLKWLVEDHCCDVNVRDHLGETLQHVAARYGQLDTLKWLVEYQGCDVNVRDNSGTTLQHVVAGYGQLDRLKWLVEYQGCDVNVRDNSGTTLQHLAARCHELDTLKWLVEDHGCDVNVQDHFGTTLQHVAAGYCRLNTLKWLVEDRGCDVKVRDNSGVTLQHLAAEPYGLDMLKWLVEARGCDVNVQDNSGTTLQHVASECGYLDALKWLVEDQGCAVDVGEGGARRPPGARRPLSKIWLRDFFRI